MFLGNILSDYLNASIAFLIAIVVSLSLKYIIIKRFNTLAERTKNVVDDFIVSLLASLRLPFYLVISIYIATQFLVLHITIRRTIEAIVVIFVVYQLTTFTIIFLDYILTKRVDDANRSKVEHIKGMLQFVINVTLWVVGLLFILSNLGVNITSLVAGLGIGGIAVALAVQNILGDLFSYFAIFFDKPFVKGDFIIAGTEMGVIEKVGVKTTRLRALQGEEIVISNSELISSRIQNFKKMEERRVLFTFGVVYQTSLEKLEKISHQVQAVIVATEGVRFDRAHLQSLGDSAYVFEVVYYVQSADYNAYMDIHQSILFRIIAMFTEEDIAFAFPTQTIHLAQRQ